LGGKARYPTYLFAHFKIAMPSSIIKRANSQLSDWASFGTKT